MKSKMFSDASIKPLLFIWEGETDRERLKDLLLEQGWAVPEDLFNFWAETGGGDIFETETLLGPWRSPEMGDDLTGYNQALQAQGLPPGYLVFHKGIALSAIRLVDGKYVRLDQGNFQELEEYSSLDDWYCGLLRKEYAERYGLPEA